MSIENLLDSKRSIIKKFALAIVPSVIAVFTSIYSVPADSVGVVQRFGKYERTVGPGLNFKIPFFVETASDVPIHRIFVEEFGFRTTNTKEGKSDYESGKEFRGEYLSLTGDLNMTNAESSVQFKIKDPVAYLFNVQDPVELLRKAHLSAARGVIGNGSVDEAIMLKRAEYSAECKKKVQEDMDAHYSGIEIVDVNFQSINPPSRVQQSFNAVNNAIQQKETRTNEARQEFNKDVPKAKGEGQRIISQASAYALDTISKAQADVARFSQLYEAYSQSPELTARRMYLENMSELFPTIGHKNIVQQ